MTSKSTPCMLAGLAFLILTAPAAAEQAVEVRQSQFTLPWFTSEPRYLTEPRASGAMWPKRDSEKPAGERTFDSVILENEYLRVEVVPEISGVIRRAVYKPTGEDIFFREGKAKDWMPFWESGVKGCFPYREHCFGMEGQPASWRVVRGDDGSVTLAMWMEFSRHNEPYHAAMFGRYRQMTLSQHVTLRPGENLFRVTYRAVNPSPFKQGARLWTDAFFPRNHTLEGIVQSDAHPPETTRTEWIYPAAWVADHLAKNIRRWEESDGFIRDRDEPHTSVFSLDIPYGFAGLWYPEVKVNRLRIFDPDEAPAAKFYFQGKYRPGTYRTHMYNFAELWGGTHNVMEGTEEWVGPGETFGFTHAYTMVRGIGKVDYADETLALNVELGGEEPIVEIVTLRDVEGLEVRFAGKKVGTADHCGPTDPARFALPAGAEKGHLVITAAGKRLLDRRFPLAMPDDTSRHEEIIAANDIGSPQAAEMGNYQMDYGRTLDGAARQYPADSLAKARTVFKLWRIDQAIELLEAYAQDHPDSGEACHLLGAALLRKGQRAEAKQAFEQAVAAENSYPAARYYLAMIALGDNAPAEASRLLARLIDAEPNHWEGRLLKAWVDAELPGQAEKALADARKLLTEDPADPRAALVLRHAARQAGNSAARKQAHQALDRLDNEPGAPRRLEEFRAATRGSYKPPQRLKPFE